MKHSAYFHHCLYGVAMVLSLSAGSTHAAYIVIDNFNSLLAGNIDGQNGWSGDSANIGEVALDPAGGSNQVLQVSTDSGYLRHVAALANNSSGTLFLRFRFEAHGRYDFGLSHVLPSEYSDFGPEMGMASATTGKPNNDFRVANEDGGSGEIYDNLELLSPDTWYNTWVQVDNAANTYQIWLNAVPGSDANPADQLDNDASETTFGFRTSTSDDLLNFFVKTGGGSSVQGQFYLDDIYLDQTELTLVNPAAVPLPPSWILMMSAGIPLLWRRRRVRPAQD
jgi:hypothetical protein